MQKAEGNRFPWPQTPLSSLASDRDDLFRNQPKKQRSELGVSLSDFAQILDQLFINC